MIQQDYAWQSGVSTYVAADYEVDVSKLHTSAYLLATWALSNGADKTFTDTEVAVADDEITISTHGYTSGMVAQLTTTGTLPAGLAGSTDYWIYVKDVDTIKLATSAANLAAGTYVNITAASGGGTHTVDVNTAAGTVKFWYSSDGSTKEKEVDATGANMASVTKYVEIVSVLPCKYIIAELSGVVGVVSSLNLKLQGPQD